MAGKQIQRTNYINKLITWKDEHIIKVISGIRRCGKSTLLKQYQEYLLQHDIEKDQILFINFEDLAYEELLDYQKLYAYVMKRLVEHKKMYILLDEIQKVHHFEKAVDSLFIHEDIDLYLTGSNAYMLSSDLSTYLSGRYVEISMLPLSFQEYKETYDGTMEEAFQQYLTYGGFPYLTTMQMDEEKFDTYMEGIYNTVIVKDIEDRDKNKRKITDILLLKTIAQYLASTVGSPISVKNITGYLTSTDRKVSANTVDTYMDVLREAFIFYPVQRFNLTGKTLLKNLNKWYIVDIGLRNFILPRHTYDLGFSLENIVYFELLRRGHRVYIGKQQETEIDFIARKKDTITYYQVTANMSDEATFQREITPLRNIKDHYEKVILTLDRYTLGNYDGIRVLHALDWLLDTTSSPKG